MAMINFGDGDYRQPDIWSEGGGGQGVTDPTTRAADPTTAPPLDPSIPDNRTPWVPDGHGSYMPPPEQAPPGRHWDYTMANWVDNAPTNLSSNGGGDLMSRITAALANARSSDDPNYWYGKISSDPNGAGSAWNYWLDRINRGDGAQLGLPRFQDGGGAPGPNPGGYTDPSSMLYLQQLLDRLAQAKQPQDTQVYDMLKSLALARVNSLNEKPYSAGDDAALITQYRQPLTQARDSAKQQAALDLSRRGIGPTSGVFQDRMKQIDQAYIGGVAQGANQMGVNAVALKQQNADKQLQILSSLLAANNNQYDRGSSQADHALDLAKMFPDFDAQRLDQLLRASGDTSSSSALSSLLSLGNTNLNTLGMNNANDSANSAAWGKLIATILQNL